MAQPIDEPNVRILPDPELNPLLNPLLAAHMGRWAEVYFTNPPEKRAEAVSELVRELTNNPTAVEVAARPTREERIPAIPHEALDEALLEEALEESPEQAAANDLTVEEAGRVLCGNCGQRNSTRQRFCGMCGERLTTAPEFDERQIAESVPATRWDAPEQIQAGESSASELHSSPAFVYRRQDFFGSERPSPSPAEQRPTQFASFSQYEPEPSSHNYRVYVGAAVAVILALLIYATWRSNTAFWSSGSAPAALPQAAPAPSNESRAATAPKPQEPLAAQPSSTNSAEPANSSAASAPPSQEQTSEDTGNKGGKARPAPAPHIVPVSVSSAAGAAEQSGSEELATAQRYLNATPGQARDSQQAASWLWKAVAKKNLTATLLLSDLYLRGDGVTKSCDQARLLLDAAARKGGTAAAERLRNLPAFGCQ